MPIKLKMHQFPGDIPKSDKINLLEDNPMHVSLNRLMSVAQHKAAGKSFKKMVRMKERAVLKERTRKDVKDHV